jgi:hypothetical protein
MYETTLVDPCAAHTRLKTPSSVVAPATAAAAALLLLLLLLLLLQD